MYKNTIIIVTKIIEMIIEKFDKRTSSTSFSLFFSMGENRFIDKFIQLRHRLSPGM